MNLGRRSQPISNSSLSQQVLRPLRLNFDLLPELSHIQSKVLGVCCTIPQFSNQKPLREHLTGMSGKDPKQFVFFWCQPDLVVVDF